MSTVRRIISFVLLCALIIALTSCSLSNTDTQEIIQAADTYSKCVQYLDCEKLLQNTAGVNDNSAKLFRDRLNISGMDYDKALVCRTIAETITYQIDSQSVTFNKNKSSCKVTFSIADYDKAIGTEREESFAYVELIKNCSDRKTYDVTLDFVKTKGRWLATEESLSRLNDLYLFLDQDYLFGSNTIKQILGTSWLFSNDGAYENTTWIELDLWFNEDQSDSFYYVVAKNGKDVCKSNPLKAEGSLFRASFNKDLGAETTADSYIAAGNYSIRIYRDDDLLLTEKTIEVKVDESKEPAVIKETPEGASYKINDHSFAAIGSLGWWNYDKTLVSDGVYAKDTKTIAFSIKLLSGSSGVYYAYYFVSGENADISSIDYSKPVASGTAEPRIYQDGTAFYNFDYKPDEIKIGTYFLVVASDKGSIDKPYITAACKVIDKNSKEFI